MSEAGPRGDLLAELRKEGSSHTGALLPVVYAELRKLARHYLSNERPEHTLQATALVHELYLRLIPQAEANWDDRGKFIGIAAHVMRQILVEHARGRNRQKRGGDRQRVPLADNLAVIAPEASDRWEDLDHALNRLADLDLRQAQIVELRYFGGLTVDETAGVLGISSKTVKRDWSIARAWLRRELESRQA
jgi:RNA polymerase sigma-70 factor (ECF subfamily)